MCVWVIKNTQYGESNPYTPSGTYIARPFDPGTNKCAIHKFDNPPELDQRLWSVDHFMISILRVVGPCQFYRDLLVMNNLLNKRVKFTMASLATNKPVYPCLLEVADEDTKESFQQKGVLAGIIRVCK